MRVRDEMPAINADAGEIAMVGSASGLLLPAVHGANYLLGYVQTGIIHAAQWPTGAEGTGRVYTRRHPNCDYVLAWVRVSTPTGNPSTFSITAGTGATQTVPTAATGNQFWVAAPWAAGDSGWLTVSYTTAGCDLQAIMLIGLVRTELDIPGGDLAIDRADTTYTLAGLDEGLYLIHAAHGSNVDGIVAAVNNARDYNLRHAVTWCAVEGSLSVAPGAGVPANPFAFTFRHRARYLRSADTYRHYRVKARTWEVGAGTYTWTISATNLPSSVTTAALAGTAGAEDETVITDLHVDCQADDTITFELTPSAAQTLHLSDLSIVEYLA